MSNGEETSIAPLRSSTGDRERLRFRGVALSRAMRRLLPEAQTATLAVARFLAIETPETGEISIRLEDVAREVSVHKNTVGIALSELVKAGLITKKRQLTGNVYRWTEAAYVRSGGVAGRRSHLSGVSQEVGEGSGRLREFVLGVYLSLRRVQYGIRGKLGYKRAHLVDWRALEECFGEIIEQHAAPDEAWDVAAERLVGLGLGLWFKKKGAKDQRNPDSKGYLVDRQHRLEDLVRDLEWLTSQVHEALSGEEPANALGLPRDEVVPVDPTELADVLAVVRGSVEAA